MRNPTHFPYDTTGWESTGKKHPYCRKGMGTNFQGFPLKMGFIAFSCTMENGWRNPCISHMMMYTLEWQSNRKKALIQWKKYEYQFPGFHHLLLNKNLNIFLIKHFLT